MPPPSLVQLCQRRLQGHIDALSDLEALPNRLVIPILSKATCEQLQYLEQINPHIVAETDELWRPHVLKKFGVGRVLEGTSWRELYKAKTAEYEAKMAAFGQRLQKRNRELEQVRDSKKVQVIKNPPLIQRRSWGGSPYKVKESAIGKLKRETQKKFSDTPIRSSASLLPPRSIPASEKNRLLKDDAIPLSKRRAV
ncbi:RNA polymerase II transcription factor SIII subunit A-domain-containing protein [Polychytrium aggregatum]|uniref:RNA polymerase II transcription factor SIII subunit A-domain-containing protein n=1 Tax=Polychytrium aggregatum TaxID=110093 RepID=UPI0022FEA91D|nr:RNA polymerase II transcription factor SIII subunit A-domain-containing protein [Polychytrium aggregatum]KAI9199359.1 RNA polymerase II transcription factor SIII subunit A-domain-containing protein [Polychytrium aggregatum]